MINRTVFLVVGIATIGLSSPVAMAMKDRTNTYFTSDTSLTSMTEGQIKVDGAGTLLIERTSSSPAMVERTTLLPVVIEDRIVKQKHAFKVGIWPLFDFEVL